VHHAPLPHAYCFCNFVLHCIMLSILLHHSFVVSFITLMCTCSPFAMECHALNIVVDWHFTKFITPRTSFIEPYSLHGNK
jgi:hypothetical protein